MGSLGGLVIPFCPCWGTEAFATPGISPSPGIKASPLIYLHGSAPTHPLLDYKSLPAPHFSTAFRIALSATPRAPCSPAAFPLELAFVSCKHPWDLPAPSRLCYQGHGRRWLCGTEHIPIPTFPWEPLLPGTKGKTDIIRREAAGSWGRRLVSPRWPATAAGLLRHNLKLTAKSAIKPQVCLELFSVLLDAPGFNYSLKSPNTSARICLPSPRGGASPAMVAPLLWQSH